MQVKGNLNWFVMNINIITARRMMGKQHRLHHSGGGWRHVVIAHNWRLNIKILFNLTICDNINLIKTVVLWEA